MNVIIVNASPRKDGNSAFIAGEVAAMYDGEAEIINLNALDMKSCTACRACKNTGSLCVIKDDMAEIYPKMLNADKIIFISPNIFGFISSLGKIFTDRFYCLKTADKKTKFEEGKKAVFIFTQGSPSRDHANTAMNWAKNFFERYGLKTFTMVIPNCSDSNLDGAKIKINEIKTNVSMF